MLVMDRKTGWSLAGLVIILLVGTVYVGSTFFRREHKVDHIETQNRQLQQSVEALELKTQMMERRIVELQTEVENLRDN